MTDEQAVVAVYNNIRYTCNKTEAHYVHTMNTQKILAHTHTHTHPSSNTHIYNTYQARLKESQNLLDQDLSTYLLTYLPKGNINSPFTLAIHSTQFTP